MSKFHINKHGVPAPCRATKGNCPLGGDNGNERHFATQEEAQAFADKENEAQHSLLPGMDNVVMFPGVDKESLPQYSEVSNSVTTAEPKAEPKPKELTEDERHAIYIADMEKRRSESPAMPAWKHKIISRKTEHYTAGNEVGEVDLYKVMDIKGNTKWLNEDQLENIDIAVGDENYNFPDTESRKRYQAELAGRSGNPGPPKEINPAKKVVLERDYYHYNMGADVGATTRYRVMGTDGKAEWIDEDQMEGYQRNGLIASDEERAHFPMVPNDPEPLKQTGVRSRLERLGKLFRRKQYDLDDLE